MKPFTIYRFSILVFVCAITLSCNSYIFGGHQPILSNCCSFNPKTLELKLTCQNESIYFVKSFILGASTNESYNNLWNFSKTCEAGINTLIIPVPKDSLIRDKIILLKVWKANQIIDDYLFQIKPSDWNSDKLLFGELSIR
ncbi:MAG: hypothetical protein V4556_00075 [Bacteroidota bacterium]